MHYFNYSHQTSINLNENNNFRLKKLDTDFLKNILKDFEFWYTDKTEIENIVKALEIEYIDGVKDLKKFFDDSKTNLIINCPSSILSYIDLTNNIDKAFVEINYYEDISVIHKSVKILLTLLIKFTECYQDLTSILKSISCLKIKTDQKYKKEDYVLIANNLRPNYIVKNEYFDLVKTAMCELVRVKTAEVNKFFDQIKEKHDSCPHTFNKIIDKKKLSILQNINKKLSEIYKNDVNFLVKNQIVKDLNNLDKNLMDFKFIYNMTESYLKQLLITSFKNFESAILEILTGLDFLNEKVKNIKKNDIIEKIEFLSIKIFTLGIEGKQDFSSRLEIFEVVNKNFFLLKYKKEIEFQLKSMISVENEIISLYDSKKKLDAILVSPIFMKYKAKI